MRKNHYLCSVFLIFTLGFNPLLSQTQVGNDINGEEAGDAFGNDVSLSADGNRLAVGAWNNSGNGEFAGHVRIFELVENDWMQIGGDLDGESAEDHQGNAVSLSADGSRVAIGAFRNSEYGFGSGQVEVFEQNGEEWVQVGTDINGMEQATNFGISVSLSADGNRLAIGASGGIGNIPPFAGSVLVYDLIDDDWEQVGTTLNGGEINELLGRQVALSADGSRMAVRARNYAQVYEWREGDWESIGLFFDENEGLPTGLSLSGDGNRLAVALPGRTEIYEWNGEGWIEVGLNIDGQASSLAFSSDGNRIAIYEGLLLEPDTVRVFDLIGESWAQVGVNIVLQLGASLSISPDGNRIATGVFDTVRVYDLSLLSSVNFITKDKMMIYPNPTMGRITLDGFQNGTIKVIGQLGRIRWQGKVSASEVDISDLPAGIYFLHIRTRERLQTHKIIKK